MLPLNQMTASRLLSVAVVDDDESQCRSLARLLRASGMTVMTYPSAEAFLDDPLHAGYDSLLLDVQLGGISGIELQRRLIESGETTPIIFITAHDEPEGETKALAAGCRAYFRKTDSGTHVIEAIRRAAT